MNGDQGAFWGARRFVFCVARGWARSTRIVRAANCPRRKWKPLRGTCSTADKDARGEGKNAHETPSHAYPHPAPWPTVDARCLQRGG